LRYISCSTEISFSFIMKIFSLSSSVSIFFRITRLSVWSSITIL
jgi:hypothetical protein